MATESVCPKHDVKTPCWCCEQEKQKSTPEQGQQKQTSDKGFSNPGK